MKNLIKGITQALSMPNIGTEKKQYDEKISGELTISTWVNAQEYVCFEIGESSGVIARSDEWFFATLKGERPPLSAEEIIEIRRG